MTHRIAVVPGGSAGLGRAIVRELASRSWDVAVLARGEEGIEAAAEEARAAGVRALAVAVDVSDAAAVEAAADRVEQELGPIELWVNNAMVSVFGEFVDIEPDDFDQVIRVVLGGYANGTRTAMRRMMSRDHGHIVQVGSALAHRGIPLQPAYCAAKHGIKSLTESVIDRLALVGAPAKEREPLVDPMLLGDSDADARHPGFTDRRIRMLENAALGTGGRQLDRAMVSSDWRQRLGEIAAGTLIVGADDRRGREDARWWRDRITTSRISILPSAPEALIADGWSDVLDHCRRPAARGSA